MISSFALMVSFIVNEEVYEAVPYTFPTEKACLDYEKKVTKNYYKTACFKGIFVEGSKDVKEEKEIFSL